jgi:predicted small lipoprotein YifL
MKVRTMAFLAALLLLAACGAKSPTEPAQSPPVARHDGTGFLGGGS